MELVFSWNDVTNECSGSSDSFILLLVDLPAIQRGVWSCQRHDPCFRKYQACLPPPPTHYSPLPFSSSPPGSLPPPYSSPTWWLASPSKLSRLRRALPIPAVRRSLICRTGSAFPSISWSMAASTSPSSTLTFSAFLSFVCWSAENQNKLTIKKFERIQPSRVMKFRLR